ncbi:hypothetical protein ACWGIU_37215, partial [Streptomyces sp. NPDC054840]
MSPTASPPSRDRLLGGCPATATRTGTGNLSWTREPRRVGRSSSVRCGAAFSLHRPSLISPAARGPRAGQGAAGRGGQCDGDGDGDGDGNGDGDGDGNLIMPKGGYCHRRI